MPFAPRSATGAPQSPSHARAASTTGGPAPGKLAWRSSPLRRPLLPDLAALDVLALHEQVGHVVLVDVANVGHRLPTDLLARKPFHVVEPDVGVDGPAPPSPGAAAARGPDRSCRRRTRRG